MSTIADHAVRALQSVFHETSTAEWDRGAPLAYCCDGPCGYADCGGCPAPCAHQSCAAVRALARAGLLDYAPTVAGPT